MQVERVRQLAREGLQRQGNQTYVNARKVGDSYLGAIAREGGQEGLVASIALNACARKMYDQSAYAGQNRALQALAAGIGGPIGPTLAAIGYDGMHKTIWHDASYAYHDGRSMGESYLDAIKAHSQDPTERSLAQAAREATNPRMQNQSAFQVQAEALLRIYKGIQGQDSARTLASFGRDARMKCKTNEDARAMASPLLLELARTGTPRQKAVADTARIAAATYLHQDVASLAQDLGFAKVLEQPTGTVAQDLADLGKRAMQNCKFAEDQRNLGQGVLTGIEAYSPDPGVKIFARQVKEVTGQHLYHFSAAGGHYDAFNLLLAGETDAERLLARWGLMVAERGQTIEDGRTMAQGALEALLHNTEDSVKTNVLASALEQCQKAPNAQVAVGVQRFAFNWVMKAPTLPKAAETGDTVDQAVLEQRIGLHENIESMLQDEMLRLNGEISTKQTRMGELATEFNPLVPQEHKALRNFKIARGAFFVGAAAFLGGAFVGGLGPTVQLGMMVGGAVLGMGGMLAQTKFGGERSKILTKFWPLRNAYDQIDGEQQALQGAVTATRAMLEPIQKAIAADRGRLEVVALAHGVEPKTSTQIAFERDMVTIGGVRINRARPKVAIGEDRDAPAVRFGEGESASPAQSSQTVPCPPEPASAG